MKRLTRCIASLILVLHGLVHLMGTAVYLKLAEIEGLPYKTTLLNCSWDVGQSGMIFFGVLWALAGGGFLIGGVAWLAGKKLNRALLLITTCFSLLLTLLDYQSAFAGAVLNGMILLLWLSIPMLERRLKEKPGSDDK